MINIVHLLSYITAVLIITWIVLDLTEARRVGIITHKEQIFVLEQRAICNFVTRTLDHCPMLKRTLPYTNNINFTLYEPRTCNASTPTLVFIPGALQDPTKHEYVSFRLACVGVRTLYIPTQLLRADIEQTFDELVIQSLKFIDYIRESVGRVSCIVGHSLGGLIALRIALIDDRSAVAAFSPFLGLDVSPCSVINHKLTPKLIGSSPVSEGNDIQFVAKNYRFIREAQKHTTHQAKFIKARTLIFISTHEHLIDNDTVVQFAVAGNIPLTYMHQSHHFGKNEACIDTLESIARM